VGEREENLVVGAGAAGLWAAGRIAEEGRSVLLLEKTPRAGTKVLASGGTRCNLTTTLGPEEAGRLFGTRGERFLRRGLRALPPLAVRERFEELGVPTADEGLEKVFPVSGKAKDVRDALLARLLEAGGRLACDRHVLDIEPLEGGGWRVRLGDGEHLDTDRLLLAPGGMSYPRTGTTGDGYAWMERLDLELVPTVPALVPLTSPADWVRGLAGVSLQDVDVRLVGPGGKQLGRRLRPVVFTHTGVSGPGAMDLSVHVARACEAAGKERVSDHALRLDLAPDVEREELRTRLIDAAGRSGAPAVNRVLEEIPRRLVATATRQAGLGANPRAHELGKSSRHSLIEALKGLEVPVDGTLGYDKAEVTAGGLALHALDPGTMRVKGRPGLLVFGELLDLDGPIGGLNFQAAFSTAELAASSACAGD
jgi:predicted Rossmann fold flavoprotein